MDSQETKEAFLKQVEENRFIIYKICNSYCKKQHERDDLAQEITYQLWRSFNHFDGSVKFSTWMYRVALNVAITFYRKSKTSDSIIMLSEPDAETADRNEDMAELENNITALQRYIHELKELDKALMILYLEEKSYSEIAEILGISETNVGTRISRVKEKLKQRFSATKK